MHPGDAADPASGAVNQVRPDHQEYGMWDAFPVACRGVEDLQVQWARRDAVSPGLALVLHPDGLVLDISAFQG